MSPVVDHQSDEIAIMTIPILSCIYRERYTNLNAISSDSMISSVTVCDDERGPLSLSKGNSLLERDFSQSDSLDLTHFLIRQTMHCIVTSSIHKD